MSGYIIPAWELKEEEKKAFRAGTIAAIKNKAMTYGLAVQENDLTVRKIMPSDLRLKNWTVSPLPGEDWVSLPIPPPVVYGFYKIAGLSLDPQAQNISFMSSHGILFIADLGEMYSGVSLVKALCQQDILTIKTTEALTNEPGPDVEALMAMKHIQCEAYLSEPIIYTPQEWCRIKGGKCRNYVKLFGNLLIRISNGEDFDLGKTTLCVPIYLIPSADKVNNHGVLIVFI